MFLTILEDRGIITRLWDDLTTRTRNVKVPVENQLAQPNSCDFKNFSLGLINRHREASFQGKLESLEFKGNIFGYQRNT